MISTLATEFSAPVPTKRVVTMTPLQASMVIGLESVLRALQYALVCPRCVEAREPNPCVSGSNAPGDALWRLDCACTVREINPATVRMMPPSGDLVAASRETLASAGLEVRCPNRRTECLGVAPTMGRSGGHVTVRCGCASHTFKPVVDGFAPVGGA